MVITEKGGKVMRDPNRIEPLLSALGEAWHKWPDQRFGQFITNFFGMCDYDIWHTEDDMWLVGLQAFIDGKSPKDAIDSYLKKENDFE